MKKPTRPTWNIAPLFALILILPLTCLSHTSYDENRMLAAIAIVENSPNTIGLRGERSIYQILPSTWREYSRIPIHEATAEQQHEVALAVLRGFHRRLERRGIVPDVYRLALAWNGGPNAKRYKPSTLNYALRVLNVYNQ